MLSKKPSCVDDYGFHYGQFVLPVGGVLLVTLLVRLLVLFYEATLKYAVIAEKKHERFIQVWSYQVLMEAPSRSMLASTDTVSVIRVSQK